VAALLRNTSAAVDVAGAAPETPPPPLDSRSAWRPLVPPTLSACAGLWLVVLFVDVPADVGRLAVQVAGAGIAAALLLEGGARWIRRVVGWTRHEAQLRLAKVLRPLSILPLAALDRLLPAPALPSLLGLCVAPAVGLRLAAALPSGLAATARRRLTLAGFVALLLPGVLLFQTTVIHDAFQYHATAISLLFNHDFDTFENFFFFNSHRSYNPYAEGSIRYLGVPLLDLLPLAVGHVCAVLLKAFGWGFAPNGFSLPYTFWLSVASSAAGVAGVVVTFQWVARRVGGRMAFAATAVILWASALPMFVFLWHGWTHTYSLLGIALFLLQRDRVLLLTASSTQWYLLGLIAGLLCLIWPMNGLILVLPLIDLVADVRAVGARRTLTHGALLVGGLMIGFAPQLAGWYGATGQWAGSSYGRVGDFFRWTEPAILPLLFSWPQHGALTWHPVLIPAFLGLLLVPDRRLALGLGVWLLLQVYVVSCWSVWWTGIGFGNRFFLNLLPAATLGLTRVVDVAWRPAGRWTFLRRFTLSALAVALVFINLSLLNAYRSDVIPMGIKGPNYVQDSPPSIVELARSLWVDAPLTPDFLTQDFWVNQTLIVSRIRTAISGDVGAWLSVLMGLTVLLAAWWVAMQLTIAGRETAGSRGAATERSAWYAMGTTVAILAGSLVLGLALGASPPTFQFLRFDAGETILRPGQKATFVARQYLEPTREIDVISFLTYAVYVPQGRAVAVVRVFVEGGGPLEFRLLAGVDTAETSAYRPEVRLQMAHSDVQATAVHEWMTRAYSRTLYPAHAFLARFALPEATRVELIEIEMLHGGGDLVLRDVFLRG
jgi:hypothetical protein